MSEKSTVIKIVIILFFLYLLLGAILPFVKQPDLSAESKDKIDLESFYADKTSTEKAMLLDDNLKALEHRLRLINMAQESIILTSFQYYIDQAGKEVLLALLNAADRGVHIKILLDGVNAIRLPHDQKYFMALAQHKNIDFRLYNPISLFRPWSINGRMHDKYMIIDEQIYTLGGRNISSMFLGEAGDLKKIDWEVLVYNTEAGLGESGKALLNYFNAIWDYEYTSPYTFKNNSISKHRINTVLEELEGVEENLKTNYPQIYQDFDYEKATVETKAINLLANPIHPYAKEPVVFATMAELMKRADTEVRLHTPYIIANKKMLESLDEICDSVPQVTMLTNSVQYNENPFAAVDYWQQRRTILNTGIDILELNNGKSYHGKAFTIDDRLASVGAFNWDMRSTYIDTELMLVIDSKEFNQDLKDAFAQYEAEAIKVNKDNLDYMNQKTKEELPAFNKVKMFFAAFINLLFRYLL